MKQISPRVIFACVLCLFATELAAVGPSMPAVRFQLFAKVEERPLLVTHDGQGRAFIVEQPGRIQLVVDGKMRDKPFLDISDKVYSQGEGGLLGLAFHPKFAQNGYFYVNYTTENKGAEPPQVRQGNKLVTQTPIKTVIAEFHVDPSAEVADVKSERSVLEIPQPYENHNGGMVAFGPDGVFYIGMGDGGNQRDPHRNGQNLAVPLAKMLRIDVSPRVGYAIPPDNPFWGVPAARPEIWAYGLRNPWRFSFDRQTGLLYAADVGEDRWEEIDIVTRGGNFGWSEREGIYPFNRQPMQKGEQKPTNPPDDHPGFVDPIKAYWHDIGQSITGGYVYRGKAIPELRAWYLYGDYSKGTIWGLRYDEGKVVGDGVLKIVNEKEVRPMLPSGFGEDSDGEIYVCSHQDGKVWKIVAGK
jgi:glucose/arabinose dehydrogenase